MPRRFRNNQPFEFTWEVSSLGYEWKTAEPVSTPKRKRRYLIEKFAVGLQRPVRRYRPLEDASGLFRTFAEIPLTHEGVQTFASMYGMLGKGVTELVVPGSSDSVHAGESFECWIEEIGLIRDLLGLWDALVSKNHSVLAKIIRWNKVGVRAQWGSGKLGRRGGWIAAQDIRADLLQSFVPGNLLSPGWHCLQQLLNAQLTKYPAGARLLWDRDLALFMAPGSLISAIWFQFAAAIDGNRDYRRCKHCRRWFEIGGARRSDAVFCSNACKFRDFRRKQ
jgi:hypothetical protein